MATRAANDIDIDFESLEPAQIKFKLPAAYGGGAWVCREASAGAAAKFKDANFAASKYEYDKDGNGRLVGIEGANENEALLVSLCVFKLDQHGQVTSTNPSLEQVKSWGNRITGKLYDWVREHSDLGDDTVEGLERQIGILTKRLNRLKASKTGSLSGNGHVATPTSSPTV